MKVRTRFAPSPTGLQHLGGLRSALFCWLLARKEKGDFILRIEDTDQARYNAEAEQYLVDALEWLGIDVNEGPSYAKALEGRPYNEGKYGPYRQSERLEVYKEYAEHLLEEGRLYRDWTSPEELTEMRKEADKSKKAFRANQTNLVTEGDENAPHVLRFKIDESYDPEWEDAVRGKQSQKANEIEDFIAIKSDGYPTYNFANVIDDHLMDITHVLRGDEFLASTPKHLQIYKAMGWKAPEFAHLPPVLGADKAKLSKRHGARPALEYKELGYLPEAIMNFLAQLGWNDGTTQEIYSKEELIKAFSLGRIQKSPAVFDEERLNWMNGYYIREKSLDELYRYSADFWPESAGKFDKEYRKQVLSLVHERLKFMAEIPELTSFFFEEPKIKLSEIDAKKLDTEEVRHFLTNTVQVLKDVEFSEKALEESLRKLVEELNTKPGVLFQIIRQAVTGSNVAPGLFETLAVLGQERTINRLNTVLSTK